MMRRPLVRRQTVPVPPPALPGNEGFLADVLAGLQRPQKELPCKYFYDEHGAQLFERICELPEYYLTRAELAILRAHLPEMAGCLGGDALLVEYGSGSGMKTRLLLAELARQGKRPAAYVPVDISREQLLGSAAALRRAFPGLVVSPVCADFTASFALPTQPAARRAVFFPGSTLGNFDPPAAQRFLRRVAAQCGPGGGLLIGVDLKKDPAVLERAYDDAAGVTRDFNLNLLRRINRELGGTFALDRFRHHARYNAAAGRIEMHLISQGDQIVHVGGVAIAFRDGESIHTENSYKYGADEFIALAASAGFALHGARTWIDAEGLFSVHYLSVNG